MVELRHPKSLARVSVHKPAPAQRLFLGAVLAIAYAVVLHYVYETMGEPRAIALAQLEAIDPTLTMSDEEYDAFLAEQDSDTHDDAAEDIDYFEERHDARDPDEHPLPAAHLPNAWAAAGLLSLLTLHALFHLMCHWMVWFRAATLFSNASRLEEGTYVQVVPHAHRGKAAICLVTRSPRTHRLGFEFQRQKYEHILDEDELKADELEGIDGPAGAEVVRLMRTPTDLPVAFYTKSQGLTDAEDVANQKDSFGQNSLSMATPTFFALLKEQLVSPLAMFQFFCAILWMLDEYWQYTAFTLFSILLMEAGTAFQRKRTMGTLNGMTMKAREVRVYREKEWQMMSTENLLPGDLISMKVGQKKEAAVAKTGDDATTTEAPKKEQRVSEVVVPCDCLLLRGSAVVNEATLTGESVPQMKDSTTGEDNGTRPLDIQGQDRVHVLFSGTSLVSSNAGEEERHSPLPATPDGGCLCYVLRTGFSSSQGELMQMIEFSQQKVSADSKETIAALLILLVFALVAAGWVLKKGLEKGDRTTHELLLKCVIIITSVVPRQLPMQMALAVNTALMALMKTGVFCSEPYRVPFAGKITHCLFDKTGTLTTDQLVPVGIVNKNKRALLPVHEAASDAAMVIGACHSLVAVEEKLVGDPIEMAGVKGVEWQYDSASNEAMPGVYLSIDEKIAELQTKLAAMAEGSGKEAAATQLATLKGAAAESRAKAARSPVKSAKILQRHHFSSHLQRMSVVCEVQGARSGKACFVKGSPEAVSALLAPGARPSWYDAQYREMAEKGQRVLALGYRWVDGNDCATPEKQPRDWVESELQFAGFIAFECKTRADSPTVVQALTGSDHTVLMLTGDAPLTALHVARHVNICTKKDAVMLTVEGEETKESLWWIGATGPARETVRIAFDAALMPEVAADYDLVSTEAAIEIAAEQDEGIWAVIDCIGVFARMSPQGKARVIRALQARHKHVLMCGDGGNDVGALKQADVGVALLSGYGNTNTTGVSEEKADEAVDPAVAEEELNRQQKELAKRSQKSTALRKKIHKEWQGGMSTRVQEWIKEEMEQRGQRGEDTGFMAQFSAMKNAMARMKREEKAFAQDLNKKYGNVYDEKSADPTEALMSEMEEGGLPMVRPGDASVAAPFTSRIPSVRSVVDLIRQGRCTLLSSLQQQQIMMLECVISAYTLSALSSEGARSSERQMMASGMLIMVASVAFSYSSPVDRMHQVRPLKSLFHPAIFLSIVGQAAIHLTCMVLAVRWSTEIMGPDKLAEVVAFHKKVRAGTYEAEDEDDPMAEFMMLWSTPFKPNLLNTVVFLVETSQMVAVLFVNYKGRPWMKGVLENHALFWSVFLCVAGVSACAWGINPQLNEMIHLEPFPDDEFRWKVVGLVTASLVGTFVWDRVITMLFAPTVFKAMLSEALNTRMKDLIPIVTSLFKVVLGLFALASSNIIVLGIGYYLYRQWNNRRAAAQAAAT